MARIVTGKVWLKWGDGNEREIGEITVSVDEGAVQTGGRMKWVRFGWEMVKAGLRMMRRRGDPELAVPDWEEEERV